MSYQKRGNSNAFLEAMGLLKTISKAKNISSSGGLSGGLEHLTAGNSSVFLESEDGVGLVDLPLKAPEITAGAMDIVLAASDVIESGLGVSSVDLEGWRTDCSYVQKDFDSHRER